MDDLWYGKSNAVPIGQNLVLDPCILKEFPETAARTQVHALCTRSVLQYVMYLLYFSPVLIQRIQSS